MSGECERCNEHCLDCKCHLLLDSWIPEVGDGISLQQNPRLTLDLNQYKEFLELKSRIEEIENILHKMKG